MNLNRKQTLAVAVLCGCLLIGSLYPRLILDHHVTLVDETGRELPPEEEFAEDIPVKLEWRLLQLFR